ncbi:BatD family protein [Granulosicoccus sp. 3-233]|uniref:BatD family protein n=1 Tax=Granulosicoccus sp. 3-233 TaxID=3417969 RepID=UPI003D33477F
MKPGNTNSTLTVGQLIFLVLALWLSQPLLAQQASVRGELSASTITRDESVTLTVTAVGVDGELDSSALDKDFDVVGQSSSRQIRTVVNGSNQPVTVSLVTWTLELLPRDVGVFTVPAVTVGGVSSQLLSLTVNEIPTGGRRDVFVEASVDSRSPWVQSQVLMTVRVFQAIEIVEGGLSDPAGADIQVQRIGKDSYSTEIRDGREYRVTERRFALFPQKSGTVAIDPVVLSVSVPSDDKSSLGFFSPTRKLTRQSDAITLDVQARPSSGTAWWLPASAVQIDNDWSDDVGNAAVDQPLTRTITLRAAGVLDAQLPDIRIPAIEGVSLYAEEPTRAMGVNERGLVAEQTIKWALIPQREGELVLPELSIEWFNTDTGTIETAVLPEERIQVGPSLATTAQATAAVGADSAGSDTLARNDTAGAPEAVADTAAGPASTDVAIAGGSAASLNPGASPTPTADGAAALVTGSDSAVATMAVDQMPGSASVPGQQANAGELRPWRLATLLLLGLWVLSVGLFWWWRRRWLRGPVGGRDAEPGALSAIGQGVRKTRQKLAPLADVEACCKADDPAALRTALMAWAARQWPRQPPLTLTDLAQRLNDGPARESLALLDAVLYSRTPTPENREQLMRRMQQLPAELSTALVDGRDDVADDPAYQDAVSARHRNGLPAL